MSSAALAKKRRAAQQPIQTSTPSLPVPAPNSSVQSQNNRIPVSIPQMFSLMEKRINTLEKEVKTLITKPDSSLQKNTEVDEYSKKMFEEYETRFDLLALEINTIKDVLLNLQTYTINVNRVLLEQNGTVDVPDLSKERLLNTFRETMEETADEKSKVESMEDSTVV